MQSLLICMLAVHNGDAAYPSCKVPESPLTCQGQCMCPSHFITLCLPNNNSNCIQNHSSFPQLRMQAVLIIVQPFCKHFHCN
ncbi:hypothetical protein BC830DRAFT_1100152 [Chytriomyces sp. MP71]|nr:hypothetical protein BC830DRAFT_1100152 [Chytriomyces sp. MP71]